MEIEVAHRLLDRSITLHTLRYRWMISYVDSETHQRIGKGYGEAYLDIGEKLDCIRHVGKRQH